MGRRDRTGAGRSVTGRRYAAAAVCLCGLVLCLSGCRAGLQTGRTPEFVFTYAENQTGDYPTTAGARYFADRVKEESGGRIEILVYANAELGDENAAVEQVRFGGIDFARASLSSLNACSPKAIVLQMPYLYKDAEHMWRVLDGEIGAEIMASFEGSGVVGLSWYDAAARSFYSSKQPIRDITDLQGMKIRVQDADYMEDMVRCLGAEPVPIVYSGVYSALETGAVDAAENNFPSYETMGHHLVAPYYTLDEHMRIPEMQIVSQVTWDRLSEEDRAMIRRCAEESARYERELWEKRNREARDKVVREGAAVIVLDEEQKEAFRRATESLYEKYCGTQTELVEKIRTLE